MGVGKQKEVKVIGEVGSCCLGRLMEITVGHHRNSLMQAKWARY
jgi:hypothetical protein